MSTTLREGDPTDGEPTPLDQIAEFVDSNDQLIKVAVHTCERPSTEAIVLLDGFKGKAVESIAPMVETRFFRTIGDEEIIDAAAGAVMSTTTRLWETATELRPDDPTHFNFDEGLKDQVVAALSAEDDSETSHANLIQAMSVLCNAYETAVQNLFEKVMTSESVVVYSLNVQERTERRRQLINFGSIALATFIGTSLAHILANKKR